MRSTSTVSSMTSPMRLGILKSQSRWTKGKPKRLPKTRSGKILRGTMRRIADGQEWTTPATIDDPAILGEIADQLRTVGYAEE